MTEERYYTLVLHGDAGIKNAQELATTLREAISGHERIGVDTQAMAAADMTTAQLLLAARSKATALGKSLFLLAPLGEPLQQLLSGAGLFAQPGEPARPETAFWTAITDQPTGNWA